MAGDAVQNLQSLGQYTNIWCYDLCPHADRPRSRRLRSAFKVMTGVGMFLFIFAAFACGGFDVVPKAGKKEASWT